MAGVLMQTALSAEIETKVLLLISHKW